MRTFVHYIPIATSFFSLAFSYILFRRWRAKGGLHLFWWGVGALMYGIGTGPSPSGRESATPAEAGLATAQPLSEQ